MATTTPLPLYLEELPEYTVVLQMVGKRSNLRDAGRWGSATPKTELVMIGIEDGLDGDAKKIALDACSRAAGEEMSPMVRLARAIGPFGRPH